MRQGYRYPYEAIPERGDYKVTHPGVDRHPIKRPHDPSKVYCLPTYVDRIHGTVISPDDKYRWHFD